MAAEYDMQEDRGLESLPLFHTMIRYNATHHTSLIMKQSSMFTWHIFAQASHRQDTVFVESMSNV